VSADPVYVTRRTLLVTIVGAACVLGGCGEPRGVSREHVDLVAWYVEDVTHGHVRDPGELELPGSTAELVRIATWLAGTTMRDQRVPPRQVAARRDRWPVLKALFLQGQAVVLDDGLVAANPQVPKEDQAYALPIVDAENLDRRTIDSLLIGMADADHGEARTWLARLAAARIALDTQGGAKRWAGKY
jgi:hypothetical protein